MKATRALLGLALLLVPAIASAQRYQPGYGASPPMPGGFQDRAGQPMYGGSLGLGGMKLDDQDVTCSGCNYSPIGVEIDGHIGGMLNERFGLMLELQGNAKTVSDNGDYGTVTLSQGAAMIAGQYYVSPKLYLKAGIGAAHLSYDYEDYYGPAGSDPVDDGGALLLGAGFEVYQTRDFAVNVQARIISAGYDGIQKSLTAGTINIGVDWFGFGNGGTVIVVR